MQLRNKREQTRTSIEQTRTPIIRQQTRTSIIRGTNEQQTRATNERATNETNENETNEQTRTSIILIILLRQMTRINGCPETRPPKLVPKLRSETRPETPFRNSPKLPFREGEHQFRKSPEKCSCLSGMVAHLRPEPVFTFSQNDRSRWDGICRLKPLNQ